MASFLVLLLKSTLNYRNACDCFCHTWNVSQVHYTQSNRIFVNIRQFSNRLLDVYRILILTLYECIWIRIEASNQSIVIYLRLPTRNHVRQYVRLISMNETKLSLHSLLLGLLLKILKEFSFFFLFNRSIIRLNLKIYIKLFIVFDSKFIK